MSVSDPGREARTMIDAAHARARTAESERDALAAELAAARAEAERLREALLGLQCTTSLAGTPWASADGEPCWCGGDDPHSPECISTRAALAEAAPEETP